MNLIQKQADQFLTLNYLEKYTGYVEGHRKLIEDVQQRLWDYKKDSHKLEFLDHIKTQVKKEYDEHMPCPIDKGCTSCELFENSLFFLQEEVEEIEVRLSPEEFRRHERIELNQTLQTILSELNHLKVGQQITYDDLDQAIQQLKDFYFLNKTNWMQLLLGKLTEMVAGGIISETASKSILGVIKAKYSNRSSANACFGDC